VRECEHTFFSREFLIPIKLREGRLHTRWKASFFNWCKLMNEMKERSALRGLENMVFTIPNNGMVPTNTKHESAST